MKHTTMNRGARRLLALLLSVAMLVSVFCATGLSFVFAAGENYAAVSFGDNFMLTTGMELPETLDGMNTSQSWTYYHDENPQDATRGSGVAGHTVLGSALGLTGAYADTYALGMNSGNDRLMMKIPADAFTAGSKVTAAITYYFPAGYEYGENTGVAFGTTVGETLTELLRCTARDTAGEVVTRTYEFTAEQINDQFLRAIYRDVPDGATAYLLGITFTPSDAQSSFYTLTANTTEGGNGHVVQAGNNAAVVAVPDAGYRFDGWYDANNETLVSSDATVFYQPLTANVTLTPRFTAIGNYAAVAFGDNFMLTTGMENPEGLDGAPTGITFYHDENGTSGTKDHTVLGSDLGLTGEYADRYALHMNSGNDRLVMRFPANAFAAGSEITATFTYYFPQNGTYTDVHTLSLKRDADGTQTAYATVHAATSTGSVQTATATLTADAVNGQVFWVIYEDGGQTSSGAYLLDVTFTTDGYVVADLTVNERVGGKAYVVQAGNEAAVIAKPYAGYDFAGWYNVNDTASVSDANPYAFTLTADTTLTPRFTAEGNYAAVAIGDDLLVSTGVNPSFFDTDTETYDVQGHTVSVASLGLTGDYADTFAAEMNLDNDRLIMMIPEGTFAAGTYVTATLTYYFPEHIQSIDGANLTFGERSGDTMLNSKTAYARENAGSVKTITLDPIPAEDVNGKTFWVIYWGDGDPSVGSAYVLDVTFSAGEQAFAQLTINDAQNGKAYKSQAGNEAAAFAVPNAGYVFDGWYDATGTTVVSNATPYLFTLTEDTTLTPRFSAEGNYAAVAIGKDFMVTTGMVSPELPGTGAWETFYHNSAEEPTNGIGGHTVTCASLGLTDPAYANAYAIKMDSDNDRLIMHFEDDVFAADTTVTATLTYYFPQNDAYNAATCIGFGKRNEAVEGGYEYLKNGNAQTTAGSVQTITLDPILAEEVNGSTFWGIYWNDVNETTDAYLLGVTFTVGEHTFATLTPEAVTGGETLVVQAGNNVGVLATPNAGYQFVGWNDATGKQQSTANPYLFTLTEDSTITPQFTGFTLTLNTPTNENGENPDAAKYGTVSSSVEATAALLTATPNVGYTFVGWYNEAGEQLSAEQEYTFLLTQNMTITPRFQATAGAADLQEALNNATTWLVGYTPATQEAYREALSEVHRLLEIVKTPTAEEVAAALKALQEAEAGLTWAGNAANEGYAAIDFRSGEVLTYNLANQGLNASAENSDGHVTFDGTNYGLCLDVQNETIWVEPAAGVFDPSKTVKVTVHYYYTSADGTILENERLGVQLANNHLGTFFADGNGVGNDEVWVYGQEATLTMYLPDSTPLSQQLLLQVARWLHLNVQGGKMYIEAIEIETVDEVPGNMFVHINSYVDGEQSTAGGGAIGGERQKGSVQAFVATPNRGYKFVKWEAVDQPLEFVNGTNTESQTMYLRMPSDGDAMNINVHFAPLPSVIVNASSADEAMGSVTGSDTYYEGEQVVLKAIPQDGYAFVGWYDSNGNKQSAEATWTRPVSELTFDNTYSYTAQFMPIISAPMQFESLTNAQINSASNQLELIAGAGVTASAVIVTDTVFSDGEPLSVDTSYALELTYYLDPYKQGATANTDEVITLVWTDTSTGEEHTITVQQNNGRDTSTDGVVKEAADSALTKTKVVLEGFDPQADTLTLTYANGTTMNLLGAKLYASEEPWRYLDFAPEAETITLPITILDYMPNGMLFEANMNDSPYNAFNLNPTEIKNYANSLGVEFDAGSLVEDTLVNGHTVYKPLVSQYLVEKMLAPAENRAFFSNLIANLNNGNGFTVSGEQEGMDAWVALIEHIQTIRDAGTIGSWETTLQKLQGQNGAPMYLKRVEGDATPYVETLYDAAYYMLNTLFVYDPAYNTLVPELNTLKLQAVGNGYYVFDSGYETVYDTETGVIQNVAPISPNHTERLEGSTDANEVANQFFPLNDLGYQDRVSMVGLDDRNFCFSLQGHGLFVYRADKNQEFLFTGDDDVHLFINGVNVLSMDGLHGREFIQVSLNSIAEKAGLEDGNVYSFDFFFMERHTQRSNMKLYTNIEILSPSMEVEKNAYVDASYATSYGEVDQVDAFTKVFYEFVLHNDADSEYTIKDLQFTDTTLGVELNALHEHAELNDETALTDLVFIIEENGTVKETYSYDPSMTEAAYEQTLRKVFVNGLVPGQTLRVRGIQHVVDGNIHNVLNVVAHYTEADGETKTLAGTDDHVLTVIPGDHVLTVDYGVPLRVTDMQVFGDMERVQDLTGDAQQLLNTVEVLGSTGTFGTLTYEKSQTSGRLLYTLNKEMTSEETFTLRISSTGIRVGTTNSYPVTGAEWGATGTNKPNLNGENLQNMHHEGAYVTFTDVQAPAGLALLKLVYANGNGSNSLVDLEIDGTRVGIALPDTGSWDTYETISFLVSLNSGDAHTVTLYGKYMGFNLQSLQIAQAEKTTQTYTYDKQITFVPANNIYYENEFVADNGMLTSQGGTWEIDGTNSNTSIPYSTQTYGQGGNTGFNGVMTYSNGSAYKGTGNGLATKFSFTFTGTGVDIYSRTNQETGEIRVLLYQQVGEKATLKKARYVDCEFYSGDLYQIPVVGFSDLDFGTYRVDVFVYPEGNEFTGDRHIFYFDGIRVYNPLGSGAITPNGYSVYLEEDELGATFISLRDTLLGKDNAAGLTGSMSGSLFYDYKDNKDSDDHNCATIEDYNTYGPKNEVYLAPDQSIVFSVEGGYTGIQVAAKSANGTEGKMTVNGTEYTVNSTMDMYFRLNKAENDTYTITNTSTEILSLTKVKLTNSNAVYAISDMDMALASLVVTADTVAYADAYLNGDTETAAALAEKMAANAAPTVPATGSESVKLEATLPQQQIEVVVESALGSYTVTEGVVIDEIDVAAAELAREALIKNLLKAN